MSAGFFGSYFKRGNVSRAQADESVHTAVDEAPPEQEEGLVVEPDNADDESSFFAESDHQTERSMPEFGSTQEQEQSLPKSSPAPAKKRRLNWLVDYIDEEDDAEAPAPARAASDSTASATPDWLKSAAYDAPGNEESILSQDESGIDETIGSISTPDPDFYRDSIVEEDHYPHRPIETVGEVDDVDVTERSISGDGFREHSVPEARYSEVPPVEHVEDDPVVTEAASAVESEDVSETPAAEETAEEEPPIPDAPIDDALIEQVRRKDRVVAMLLRKEVVTPQQVANAQQKREREGHKESMWRVLATLPTVDSEAVFKEAAQVYAFRTITLGEGGPDIDFARSVMDTFPENMRDRLIKARVLPFAAEMEKTTGAIKLVFVTHDPTRPEMHKMMQDLKLERFELRYGPESFVKAFIQEAFPRKNEYLERMSEGSMRYDLGASFDEDSSLIDEEALEAEISRSSLINLFEATLVEAVRRGASDIHIYPNAQKQIEVHFRVDGRLGHWHTENKVHPEALLAVIKDNAMNVDRFERDSAQDGFIQRWIDDALIRFRVSVLPIANATQELRSESIVIRVLDDRKVITDLRTLGLLDTSLERFEMAIRQPHGMVILTGPTGSGKSTTLVAAMHQVVTPEVNVLTVEDPVEYIIPGVRQIKLNHKLGLEQALRAILRHDPDVVMVGEMRDKQTADLAIKLANTGHLTFSTLHTNDAPSAVSRLFKMGIEPFLIAYAINMVVAQRLIRTLCPECKTVDPDPDPVMMKKLGFSDEDIAAPVYREGHNSKCKSCKGVGFKGRRAVTEALYFSRPIRHLIVEAQNAIDEEAIRKQAVKEGMLTLRDSAREIVKMGETSITEMIRVVTSEH
jgi:type IV pilus assembly protein PilB